MGFERCNNEYVLCVCFMGNVTESFIPVWCIRHAAVSAGSGTTTGSSEGERRRRALRWETEPAQICPAKPSVPPNPRAPEISTASSGTGTQVTLPSILLQSYYKTTLPKKKKKKTLLTTFKILTRNKICFISVASLIDLVRKWNHLSSDPGMFCWASVHCFNRTITRAIFYVSAVRWRGQTEGFSILNSFFRCFIQQFTTQPHKPSSRRLCYIYITVIYRFDVRTAIHYIDWQFWALLLV